MQFNINFNVVVGKDCVGFPGIIKHGSFVGDPAIINLFNCESIDNQCFLKLHWMIVKLRPHWDAKYLVDKALSTKYFASQCGRSFTIIQCNLRKHWLSIDSQLKRLMIAGSPTKLPCLIIPGKPTQSLPTTTLKLILNCIIACSHPNFWKGGVEKLVSDGFASL